MFCDNTFVILSLQIQRILCLFADSKHNAMPTLFYYLKDYKPLFNASKEERNDFKFSPFGIHWEKLDEDLYFNGFIWK